MLEEDGPAQNGGLWIEDVHHRGRSLLHPNRMSVLLKLGLPAMLLLPNSHRSWEASSSCSERNARRIE